MDSVFNIVLILLVLLIAYWWANQGLFSAILHLVCVIAAGAIALALWEPITNGLLLRGTPFDNYAWGVSLIGVFAVSLLGLRVMFDKIVRANVQIPNWANLAFGFPVGALAGILTMGIYLIGAGHVQSSRNIMGIVGYARDVQDGRVKTVDNLWLPVHTLTYEFYSMLSVGSLYPDFERTPLRQYSPELDVRAVGLFRDSALGGKGKVSLAPGDARIEGFAVCAEQNTTAVAVDFGAGARDYGEQMTLSASQVRLISDAKGTAEAKVAFPDTWTQYDGLHKFDSITHYVTSQPGQSQANIVFLFNIRDWGTRIPRFIEIRGQRFKLPPRIETCDFSAIGGGDMATSGGSTTVDAGVPAIDSEVTQDYSIRPIMASVNQKPSGIDLTDNFISSGEGEFIRGATDRVSRTLQIKGVFEPAGTRIVKVDVSRESPANIFGTVMEKAGTSSKIVLVDSLGRTYQPVGYIFDGSDTRTRIKVDFQRYIATIGQLPILPTSGGDKLRLLFAVTDDVTLAGFKVGDVTVGTLSLLVRDPKIKRPDADKPSGGGLTSG